MNLLPVIFAILFITTSCQTLPQLYQTLDDIEDSAIQVKVDKSAIQKDTDLQVNVTLSNKNSQTVK